MPTQTVNFCPALPGVPDELKITLPFGGEMKAVRDFSQGIPNDCSMAFSLSMPFAHSRRLPKPPLNPLNVGELIKKLDALADCFPPKIHLSICSMIKDILLLIIKLLRCVNRFIRAITTFNATIDFDTAQGNPALLEILDCAKSNSQLTLEHLLASLKPVQTVLESLLPLADFAQLNVEFPSLADLSPDAGYIRTWEELREATGMGSRLGKAIKGTRAYAALAKGIEGGWRGRQ